MIQNKELIELLDHISEKAFITSEQLAERHQLGIRTIRKRIKELNGLLKGNGACIESKARYGYRIEINDKEAYQKFHNGIQKDNYEIPVAKEERIIYLLLYFLEQVEYCKADDLVEELYISKGTLSADLKQIEQIVNSFAINMERRPNYGMRLNGDEFNVRRCIATYLYDSPQSELMKLSGIIFPYANTYGISFSEIAMDQFVKVLYVQIMRIKKSSLIQILAYEISYLNDNEKMFIQDLKNHIQENYKIQYTEEEEKYLALHFAGKRMIDGKTIFKNHENFIIHSFVEKLVSEMLEQVYEKNGVDLRGNFQLIMSLSQHMVPLDIRIRYGIFMENPMLEIIKEKYLLGYNIAIQAVKVLNSYYNVSIAEDEIGLIALIFALSLEQIEKKKGHKNFRVLIVCNSGKAMSQLLKVQFQQKFSEFIDEIYVSDIFSIETFDFSKIDYVFSTVPIQSQVPVPIQEISLFMDVSEQQSIQKFLENQSADDILRMYCEQHFFTGIKGTTREEVLVNICNKVYEVTSLKDGLFESVMRRELLSSTDYGNMVAIPHPDCTWTDQTYVFVSVLDNEILWNRYKVKVVFLILVAGCEEGQQKEFYEITTKFVTNKEAIQHLIEDSTYDMLVKGLIG